MHLSELLGPLAPYASLIFLGIIAGILTTMSGQGGGLFMLLVLGVLRGPHEALALSSPALLFGNAHRGYLCRHEAAWGIALRLAAGAIPGAIFGGFFAGKIPAWCIDAILVALTAFAFLRAAGKVRLAFRASHFPFAGFVVGVLTGAAGGAGVLLSPILLSTGLTGRRFVGTAAMVAVTIHAGRVLSYMKTGLLRPEHAGAILVIAAAIFAGNAIADRMRAYVSARASTRIEYATLSVCVFLSVCGLAR